MRCIPLSQIIIPANRQRENFAAGPLEALANSIADKGLLHPPVFKKLSETEYELVAGERRSRAIRALHLQGIPFDCDGELVPPDHIPAILLSDLSSFQIREAELEENIIREPLTWQEEARAIAELHALRSEQAQAEGRKQTIQATATEIKNDGTAATGSLAHKVTEAVILSKHLDDPEVAKAKTPKEAVKLLRKKVETEHRAKLAREFNPEKSPHIPIQGSVFEVLPTLNSAQFDIIVTDPPYGVNADKFGDMASTGHVYEDTPEYGLSCYQITAIEGFRVAKPQATLYAFLDIRSWDEISTVFLLAGWDVWPTPLIWSKKYGMLPKPDYGPRRTYEAILMATKGAPRFLKTGAPDVLEFPQREELVHGAQKPVDLYVELLTRSALPGSVCADFFSGSGTIFEAATRAKMVATGIELSEQHYQAGLARMTTSQTSEDILDNLE
jgi:ParB-like chromosome segregation protein Spo0J/DNA modification methylase